MGKIGVGWNYGKTKETDERIAKYAMVISKKLKGRKHTPEHIKKVLDGIKRWRENNPKLAHEVLGKGMRMYHERLKSDPQKYFEHQSNAAKCSIKKCGPPGKYYHTIFKEKYPELYHSQLTKARHLGGLVGGKIGGKRAAEVNRSQGTSVFDKNIQRMGANAYHTVYRDKHPEEYHRHHIMAGLKASEVLGKEGMRTRGIIASRVLKEKKLGVCYDKKFASKRREWSKKGVEVCRRKGVGVFNPDHQRRAGKLGGLASIVANRKNHPYWFMGVPFDSNGERDVAMWLNKNFNFVPQEGINCHVRVDGGEIDFRPNNGVFLEYHPWDRTLTRDEYFAKRRELLNKNGYENCKLVTCNNMNDLEEKKGWL